MAKRLCGRAAAPRSGGRHGLTADRQVYGAFARFHAGLCKVRRKGPALADGPVIPNRAESARAGASWSSVVSSVSGNRFTPSAVVITPGDASVAGRRRRKRCPAPQGHPEPSRPGGCSAGAPSGCRRDGPGQPDFAMAGQGREILPARGFARRHLRHRRRVVPARVPIMRRQVGRTIRAVPGRKPRSAARGSRTAPAHRSPVSQTLPSSTRMADRSPLCH